MSRSEHRGGSYVAIGEGVIADARDRHIADEASKQNHYVEVERDWSSRDGAVELKRRIESFWRDQGYLVHCRVEPAGFGAYAVRSDLKSRLPGRR